MKRKFKDMGISLLTGVCFTVGILVVLLAKEIYDENRADEETWADMPDNVVVTSHGIKPNAPRLTVAGKIHNGSQYDWEAIWVDVEIYADTALVNTCDDMFRHIPAQTSKQFEVRCYDVAGTNLPDNIRYEVRVRSGRR